MVVQTRSHSLAAWVDSQAENVRKQAVFAFFAGEAIRNEHGIL
jgi:hypothetical protein